jgi:hypothetical protein
MNEVDDIKRRLAIIEDILGIINDGSQVENVSPIEPMPKPEEWIPATPLLKNNETKG